MGLPTPSEHQEQAITSALDWYRENQDIRPEGDGASDFYLGGFAGTGKSTILPTIIDRVGVPPEDIQFCAPTGKAAKVMSEKLKAYGIDRRARTIHSLIYRPRPLRAEIIQKALDDAKERRDYILTGLHEDGITNWRTHPSLVEIDRTIGMLEHDLDKAFDESEGPKFYLNPDSDLRKAKLLVLDELSMVGTTIAEDLRGFGVPILGIGDPGQLPPVGENPGFTNREPDFFMTEIHRQARDNPIIALSILAREGRNIKPGKYGDGVEVVERIRDDATYDMDRNAQIIVGTNKRRWKVTNKLRKKLGYLSSGPCAGEPLIICKNSRTIPDFVNGAFVNCVHDTGDLQEGSVALRVMVEDEDGIQRTVVAVQGLFEEHKLLKKGESTAPKNLAFRARIDNEHLDWGWAITCHRVQGSQWDDVILHDESGAFREDAARWLYTGISRAAKRLTLVL